MPTIDAELLKALSPMAVLLLIDLLIIWGFISGRIRTALSIREVREDRDARLADKDRQIAEWREAHRGSEDAREVQATALRESLDTTRATVELMRAWRSAAQMSRDESGST
jgi:hypothetical protein